MRSRFAGLLSLAALALCSSSVRAQRFEGIITMKLSGGMPIATGNRGGAPGRGGDGRSVEVAGTGGRPSPRGGGGAGISSGRGDGRGGDARGNQTPSNIPANDPRMEAMRGAMANGVQQVEYMTRRGKVRIGLGGSPGASAPAAMIYSPDDGLVYTIFPALSMYAEMSINAMTAAAGSDSARAAPRPPVVTHTKQFELIAGHRCEHITVTSGKQKTDVCMGKGLGVFIMPAAGRSADWNQVMTEANGFPLKVTGNDGTVIMEVTKIERKALGEALFNVPESFTKMPDFGRRPPG